MRKTAIFITALLFSGACNANAKKELSPEFKKVFESISGKAALSVSFDAHIKKMAPLCSERDSTDPQFDRMGNVKCSSKAEVIKLDMVDSTSPAVTMVTATIAGTEKCAYMRSTLIQLYGKPDETQGNCNSNWAVKRGEGKPIVHVVIEEDKQDNVIYFRNQEEQGP